VTILAAILLLPAATATLLISLTGALGLGVGAGAGAAFFAGETDLVGFFSGDFEAGFFSGDFEAGLAGALAYVAFF